MENVTDSKFKKCSFIKELLVLINSSKNKYSAECLIFACSMYFSSPSSYCFLRNSGYITLPHPNYIRKLSSNSEIDSPGCEESHKRYLQQHLCALKEEERLVNFMLDEIHIKSLLGYKGGKMKGSATNTSGLANSLQAFMVSSLRSSYKDIVALYPVKNITADNLLSYTINTLKILHEVGYKVISLISDNNRVNRCMFEKLCGGTLASKVKNPADDISPLFLLFDTVHLVKCIRNNWFNQRTCAQTLS